jgi:MoaA/NifB/PqqE/SkfB family radical SAM enzyme
MDIMNWGEPLLNTRLPAMISSAKSHRIEVRLDTNFNDANEALIEELILSGLDILSLSIDGISPETYGRYRSKGKFERVLANLEILVRKRQALGRKNPWIVWQFLVFRHNDHEVSQVDEFARARGVDQVSLVAPFLPNEPGYLWEWMSRNPKFQLYPLPAQVPGEEEILRARNCTHLKKIDSSVAFHVRRFRPGQLLGWGALWAMLRGISSYGDLKFFLERLRGLAMPRPGGPGAASARPHDGGRICKWPWAGLALNPDGSASACCSVEDEADDFGNVFRDGLKGLWNGVHWRAARRHVRRFQLGHTAVRLDSDHVCERCSAIGGSDFRFPTEGPSLGARTRR